MKTQDMTTTRGNDQFYPTPPSVAEKMLAGLDFTTIFSVLEPSAGKGDLIRPLVEKFYIHRGYGGRTLDVDAIEIDPYLRQICKYEFSDEKRGELYDRFRPLDQMYVGNRTEAQKDEYRRLQAEIDTMKAVALHIVHDDFLTYRSRKHYDLILMNPPFANGDLHLLKAIDMQRGGGKIVCLLNAETLRNPCTNTRKQLAVILERYGAKVEFIPDAFSGDAERKARVDVAIVRIDIETPEEKSDIWERMEKAAQAEEIPDPELHALAVADLIEGAIQRYNVEVAATMELYRQYRALCPYMSRSLKKDSWEYGRPLLTLTVTDDNYVHGFDLQKYMRLVRLKYWEALFNNPEFTKRLTSDLQKQYQENVSRMADYEFSAFNIKQIMLEMNASISQGVQDAIMKLFEEMTVEHSWYPECKQNVHYFNGWATNKAHKVGKKVIIPTYCFQRHYDGRQEFDRYRAEAVISDLEKSFDYLGGKRPEGYNLSARLAWADGGSLRNVEFAYFKVDFYKKGTMHIMFLPDAMPLVDRLNIYAARDRKWLPPNYGKATYSSMDARERAEVDSFHGDGSEGSGQKAYAEVLAKRDFYLSEPTQQLQMLGAGT